MRALLCLSVLFITLSTPAAFWGELQEYYPSKYESINFISLCMEESHKVAADAHVKEFARNLGHMATTYHPASSEWETILTVFDVFIRENMRHPLELADLLKDKDLFVNKLKERMSFLFEAGLAIDSPYIKKR
jgi:hypothetical protein